MIDLIPWTMMLRASSSWGSLSTFVVRTADFFSITRRWTVRLNWMMSAAAGVSATRPPVQYDLT